MRSRGRVSLAALLVMAMPACGGGEPPPVTPQDGVQAPPSVRVHALDCGRADIQDMSFFGDDGGPRELVAACYLVHHPRGALLWDTGIDDAVARTPGGVVDSGSSIRFRVEMPLRERLSRLQLAPEDVDYVAFSHLHVDHAGNANLFPGATWLLNRRELPWATSSPAPQGIEPALFSSYKAAQIRHLDGETDVFGDGSVTIVPSPGHTPGHQSLLLRLHRAGTFLISGDLTHTHGNWEHRRVPPFNTDQEETLRSMDRLRALAESTGARFVVQHEPDELSVFPPFPGYLD
ncbi:N-acyl homoserine lactonase family protein [Chondromyces crocatus]|uniref:AttM/AiiB family protein n=1 Tax=Chondromyces crocatus TaxID=52 RepID=A0A0K1EKR3_CHOCO|nr:N-acyl homoserine lactonase family protein [Chondromyces crocatus]AKT41474.1 AttM/AiiB family protein [Chondromyces crocatus]